MQSAHTRRPAQRRRAGGTGLLGCTLQEHGSCSMLLRNLLTKGIGRRLITAACVQECVCEHGSDAQVPGTLAAVGGCDWVAV